MIQREDIDKMVGEAAIHAGGMRKYLGQELYKLVLAERQEYEIRKGELIREHMQKTEQYEALVEAAVYFHMENDIVSEARLAKATKPFLPTITNVEQVADELEDIADTCNVLVVNGEDRVRLRELAARLREGGDETE